MKRNQNRTTEIPSTHKFFSTVKKIASIFCGIMLLYTAVCYLNSREVG